MLELAEVKKTYRSSKLDVKAIDGVTLLVRHFGLEHRIHHVPAEPSVGERQRVALARALFNRPTLILADEPTGNLDPDNAVTVLDALREYADDGGAVLMVTHDPNAAQRAHRTMVMDQGQLVDGSP